MQKHIPVHKCNLKTAFMNTMQVSISAVIRTYTKVVCLCLQKVDNYKRPDFNVLRKCYFIAIIKNTNPHFHHVTLIQEFGLAETQYQQATTCKTHLSLQVALSINAFPQISNVCCS